jgi:hypothetical protein
MGGGGYMYIYTYVGISLGLCEGGKCTFVKVKIAIKISRNQGRLEQAQSAVEHTDTQYMRETD